MSLAQIERIVIFSVGKIVDLSCKVYALPYKRVYKDHCCGLETLQLQSAPRTKTIFLHSCAWLWAATHLLVWIADAINNGLGVSFSIHLIFIIAVTMLFVHSLEINFNPDGLKSVQNRFEEMQSYFKRRWAHHPVAYLLLLGFPCWTVACPLAYAAIYLWKPTLPMFFTANATKKLSNAHVLAEGIVMQVICKSIGACLELMFMFWITVTEMSMCQPIVIVSVSLPVWLKELRERVKNAPRQGPWRWKREVQHCLKLYNTLRIFNTLGNDFFGRSILPAIPALLIAVTSCCLFCSVRLHDVLPSLLYAFFPATAFFVLTMIIPGFGGQVCGASIHSTAVRRDMNVMALKLQKAMLLTKMRDGMEELLMVQKSLESLNPIRMQLGIFGSWEVTTTAVILEQVISCTLLLLSF